jgi:lipopolysaccharide heptosyltransferase I
MNAVKHMPLRDFPAHRIALIKPSALGDIVHSLPVLTAVRQRYPEAYIAWVVNRDYEALLLGHPDLDATIPFERKLSRSGTLVGALSYGRFYRYLWKQEFDLVIDLQGLLRSGLMSAATNARRRVGLSSAREGARWFYTDVISVGDFEMIHAVDRYWLVAAALGVGDMPKQFRLPLSEGAIRWVAEVLGGCPRPWLALAVGSRWVTKRWPPQHFAELARRSQELTGGTIVFVGGAEDTVLASVTSAGLSGLTRDLTGQTTLAQLTALLASVDAMVGNDTGPLHLAAALGRPVVAPYTCTKVKLNGPYGTAAHAVETRVWCAGSYLQRCGRLECMAELTPNRLWPVLEQVLRRWQSRSLSA